MKKLACLLLAILQLVPVAAFATCSSNGSSPATWTCTDSGTANGNTSQLVSTIGSAACGDTIVIPASGAAIGGVEHSQTRLGSGGSPVITYPNKSCTCSSDETKYITIQSANLANLPDGVRVSYASIPDTAIIRGATNSFTLAYANGAGCVKWKGITFTTADLNASPQTFSPGIIYPAIDDSTTMHHVEYDRVVVRPYEEQLASPDSVNWRSAEKGIRMDGAFVTIKNSYIDGFCCQKSNLSEMGQQEGIKAVGGTGPFTITNNFVGAYGWNIFTGGGGGGSPQNQATLSAATTSSATLSNTTGLSPGMIIRFKYDAGIPDATCCANGGNGTPPSCGGTTLRYAAATVNTVVGNDITFTFFSSPTAAPTSAPDIPGEAAWNGGNLKTGFTVTRNTFNKREAWKSNSSQCKSFWEIKEGSNILFEGNILQGPIDTGSGTYCPMNTIFPTNQSGQNPWAETKNNVFRSNLGCGLGAIFHTTYNAYCPVASDAGDNAVFSNNLLANHGRFAFFINTQRGNNVTIEHNTVRGATRFAHANAPGVSAGNTTGMIFRSNIVTGPVYYFNPIGSYPSLTTSHNKFVDGSGACTGSPTPGNCNSWTGGTQDFGYANVSSIGFVNVTDGDAMNGFCTGGDYHSYALSGGSAIKNGGHDGTDPGVNFTTLDAALGITSDVGVSPKTNIKGRINFKGNIQVK